MPEILPPPLFDPRLDALRAEMETTKAQLKNVLRALNEVLILHEDLIKQQHAAQTAALKDAVQVQLDLMRERSTFSALLQAITAPHKGG